MYRGVPLVARKIRGLKMYMYIGSSVPIIILLTSIIIYFIAVIYLTKKKTIFWGLVLPAILGDIALYNFLKPMLVHNPNPTMKEGIYMTFFGALSILGFLIFGITRFININKIGD